MSDRTPSQAGRRSRTKGAQGERELVHVFEAAGIKAHRGLSQCRGGGAEEADVVLDELPQYHLEVKRGKKPNLHAAYKQAAADASAGQVPVAVTRCDGEGWRVTLALDEFIRLLRVG